jgi:membrane protein YdbS with pleckstrin-like domain
MLISVFGFLFTITAIWDIIDFDRLWQILVIFTVLAVSIALVSLLLQIRTKTNIIKYSLIATIIFISIVALMLIKSAINKFEDSQFFFRLLGYLH